MSLSANLFSQRLRLKFECKCSKNNQADTMLNECPGIPICNPTAPLLKGSNRVTYREHLYICGRCSSTFDTICLLHKHLLDKGQVTSYIFDIPSRTAHPCYGYSCNSTQTEPESILSLDSLASVNTSNKDNDELADFEDHDIEYSLNENKDQSRSTEDINEIIRIFDLEDTDIQISDGTGELIVPQQEDYIEQSNSEDSISACVNEQSSKIMNEPTNKPMPISFKRKRHIDNKNGQAGFNRKSTSKKINRTKKYDKNKLYVSIDRYIKNHSTTILPYEVDDQNSCTQMTKKTKEYTCDVCNSHFSSRSGARRHSLIHAGLLPYSCDKCEKKYRTLGELNLHKSIHSDQKNKMCQFCGEMFSNALILRQHIKVCQDLRPFTCSINDCDKSFRNKNSLLVHERNHTGETPYICDICGSGFTRSDSLSKHMYNHTGSKPWACESCPKSFTSKYHLHRHVLTHTGNLPYVCHCGKNFTQNWNLKAHMRKHTGEKPYICEICGAEFAHNVSKKIHMKLHEDGRPVPHI